MCFLPFVATKSPPTLVPAFPCTPGTALNPLRSQYASVASRFTLPHVAELQIAQGCGCWLRRVDFPTTEEMDYIAEFNATQPGYNPEQKQSNHDSLVEYLTRHFRQDEFVEFFGFFEGNQDKPTRGQKQIPLSAIRHPRFHFHTSTLYRLTMA